MAKRKDSGEVGGEKGPERAFLSTIDRAPGDVAPVPDYQPERKPTEHKILRRQ